ncbi:flagellin [Thiomicrorhabdus sediminis]|uniref:Flagellin n=1 Tax=Thiomicrorhabdus sediminis TaxID=2580412 RepID=A0A4V1HHW9_9GAMM|nr:flagellin [Thiomicrorhabdus sediminis]QCU90483.1 flagellar hook-associated protein 3 [Thiomicrorhabdus sediminis]
MRISTNLFHNQGINSIQKHQEAILDSQLKLSTGKRINVPSDDPVAMNQAHSIKRTISIIEQNARNGEFAQAQLVLEETSISNTVESLQRARELSIQMLNGTYNQNDRVATAEEIDQIILQVRNMMNYETSEGEQLFAGNVVLAERAYIEDPNYPGYYTYIGSPNANTAPEYEPQALYGARHVQIGFDDDNELSPDDKGDASRVRITDNGAKVFAADRNMDNANIDPTTGVDNNILNVLVSFSKVLKGEADLTQMAVENGDPVNAVPTLDDIADQLNDSINGMTLVRAEIGGRMTRIETQYDAGQSFKIALEEHRVNLEETDVVTEISNLTKYQSALQMAQQVFSQLKDMSLFNYLR